MYWFEVNTEITERENAFLWPRPETQTHFEPLFLSLSP